MVPTDQAMRLALFQVVSPWLTESPQTVLQAVFRFAVGLAVANNPKTIMTGDEELVRRLADEVLAYLDWELHARGALEN